MLGVKQFKGDDMPRGPQGHKRPADTVANAIRVAKILTGEIEWTPEPKRNLQAPSAEIGRGDFKK
jgi:hypothetical protein